MEEAEEPKPMATARLVQRPRVLYSCGVSALTVARRAYHRVEHLAGPVGALAKKLASWVVPILYPLEQRWLCLLSFADSQVLAVENAVVSVFPSAAHLLGLLDELAMLSEDLPKMFDDAADHLPAMIRRAPLVGWVSAELGEGWKLLASVWEDGRAGDQEREIGVDTVGDERPALEGAVEEERAVDGLQERQREAVPPPMPLLNSLDDDKALLECNEERVRCRGREAKAMVERIDRDVRAREDENIIEDDEEEVAAKRPADGAGAGATQPEAVGVVVKDPILELFDEGWCMHRH